MKFQKTIILLFMTAVVSVGCSANSIKPGAERVRIMQSEPKGCKYLGEVTGDQGGFFTGGWTSNKNLETGARNELKNQAFDLGGNVIVLLTNRAGSTGTIGEYGGSSQQTNVVMTGTVFNCPESILTQ
jgi:hypothetical protein